MTEASKPHSRAYWTCAWCGHENGHDGVMCDECHHYGQPVPPSVPLTRATEDWADAQLEAEFALGEPAGSVQRLANALDEVIRERDQLKEQNRRLRQEAFNLNECSNGPDEDGTWPCNPQVVYGSGWAECQVCGRTGQWPAESSPASSPSKAAGGWCELHGGYLGQRCATCALEVADSAPASEPKESL